MNCYEAKLIDGTKIDFSKMYFVVYVQLSAQLDDVLDLRAQFIIELFHTEAFDILSLIIQFSCIFAVSYRKINGALEQKHEDNRVGYCIEAALRLGLSN